MLISTDVNIGPQTAYAKEICKHEAHHTQYGPPGRPYVYREYPHRMYKPKRVDGGVTFEAQDADDESQRERLERQGFFFGGQGAALEALEKQEYEMAELAANRVIPEQRMSDKARAEAAAVDESTIRHLPVISEANKKSGRRD